MRNNVKPRFARVVLAGSFFISLLIAGLGCSDKSRRMGEAETLKYKRDLISASKTEISPVQADKLMYFPGRTQGEIDAYFDQLKAEYAQANSAEAARVGGGRKASGTSTPASTPGKGSPQN